MRRSATSATSALAVRCRSHCRDLPGHRNATVRPDPWRERRIDPTRRIWLASQPDREADHAADRGVVGRLGLRRWVERTEQNALREHHHQIRQLAVEGCRGTWSRGQREQRFRASGTASRLPPGLGDGCRCPLLAGFHELGSGTPTPHRISCAPGFCPCKPTNAGTSRRRSAWGRSIPVARDPPRHPATETACRHHDGRSQACERFTTLRTPGTSAPRAPSRSGAPLL